MVSIIDNEGVDLFSPDLFWVDANFGGTKEVSFAYKSFDIPTCVAMRDLKNGVLNESAYETWVTTIDMS